jgi:hypothetical protein
MPRRQQAMQRKLTSSLIRLAIVGSFCMCSGYAHAQANSIERQIKVAPDVEVRVGIYTSLRPDCTAGPLPAIRLAVAPEHGTVTVRRAMLKATNLKQCLGTEVPAFVAFYRASQGSNSEDHFDLEVNFSAGRKQTQHFHVNILNAANNRQRI